MKEITQQSPASPSPYPERFFWEKKGEPSLTLPIPIPNI
jgi:hypothetical protein